MHSAYKVKHSDIQVNMLKKRFFIEEYILRYSFVLVF